MDNDTNNERDIFVHDTQTGTTARVNVAIDGSQANDRSYVGAISSDGRHITFMSSATNLVDNDTNGYQDIFLAANPLYPGNDSTTGSETSDTNVQNNTSTDITLQIGTNNTDDDRLSFNINATTVDSLSLTDSSLSTLEGAQSAINSLDTAIDFLNDQRSNLGAITNRLEFAHSNVYSGIQNTEASLSTIRDADFAKEASNLAKSQILTQAGSAMLAQANNLSQNILSLLR